ncbi:MAG: hypothetical protein K6V73_11385 [Firmicutes bacterium]|nr:hypothetical protein [Bacillota bacterium]
MAGRQVRVEVRLRGEEAEALDRLARRFGGKARALRAGIAALERQQEILDRLDRIEARLAAGGGATRAPEAADRDVLRAVAAGILALEEEEGGVG